MAINILEKAALFQKSLDLLAVQELTTGWMDKNAGQVKYSGGKEVKIPKMELDGLGNYDMDNGFERGSVKLEYETREMTQDRGRSFQLDPREVDESNFVPEASRVMGEFQRTRVIPEIDAYRISKVATDVITADKAGMIEYGYTPGATDTSALRKLKEAIKASRDSYLGPLVCQATSDFILELEMELSDRIRVVDFAKGGIVTKVPMVDGVPIIETSSDRMVTSIKINDGKTEGQKQGGFEKGTSAKDINFFVSPSTAPIAVTKLDNMRIFDPNTNQKANAWLLDYRRFHDLWTLNNQIKHVFLSIKEAKS